MSHLKNACVMGPLLKLWMLVEEARRSKEKHIPIDLDNIRAYIEKTVLLLGQTGSSRREICLEKSSAITLWLHPNKKKQAIEIFAEKGQEKTKSLEEYP